MQGNVLLAGAVMGVLVIAGVWDIVSYASLGKIGTVSSILTGWSRAAPIFAVAVGVIIGHLFWPADRAP